MLIAVFCNRLRCGAHGTFVMANQDISMIVCSCMPLLLLLLVLVSQIMSITETQYSGEDVLFISPDSELLSVLQVKGGQDLGWRKQSHV